MCGEDMCSWDTDPRYPVPFSLNAGDISSPGLDAENTDEIGRNKLSVTSHDEHRVWYGKNWSASKFGRIESGCREKISWIWAQKESKPFCLSHTYLTKLKRWWGFCLWGLLVCFGVFFVVFLSHDLSCPNSDSQWPHAAVVCSHWASLNLFQWRCILR